jgi:hypothetical protein
VSILDSLALANGPEVLRALAQLLLAQALYQLLARLLKTGRHVYRVWDPLALANPAVFLCRRLTSF